MGSENARVVAEYGGSWLKGNEFMLLNTLAWNCFDPPAGPNGEKPLQVFMSAQTISAKAFGQFMPDLPPKERQPFSGDDKVDAMAYKSANNRITAARSVLIKLGVLVEKRRAGNWTTGQYELNLDRIKELGQEHFAKSSVLHDGRKIFDSKESMEQHSKETVESEHIGTRSINSLNHKKRGTGNKEIVEQGASVPRKPCPRSKETLDIKNNVLTNLKNTGDESKSSQATTSLVDDSENFQNEGIPPNFEEQKNRDLAALRAAHPEEFQTTPDTEPVW